MTPDNQTCAQPPGRVAPQIDASRCEGKADCVRVCPYEVFEIRTLRREERQSLPAMARLKVWVHGGKQGFVVAPDQCHACGLCVQACPEKAIRLVKRPSER